MYNIYIIWLWYTLCIRKNHTFTPHIPIEWNTIFLSVCDSRAYNAAVSKSVSWYCRLFDSRDYKTFKRIFECVFICCAYVFGIWCNIVSYFFMYIISQICPFFSLSFCTVSLYVLFVFRFLVFISAKQWCVAFENYTECTFEPVRVKVG